MVYLQMPNSGTHCSRQAIERKGRKRESDVKIKIKKSTTREVKKKIEKRIRKRNELGED